MLYRKIEKTIYQHFESKTDKILVLTGARQTGKSYILRHVASRIFSNFVEINLIEDYDGPRLFESISSLLIYYVMFLDARGSTETDILL